MKRRAALLVATAALAACSSGEPNPTAPPCPDTAVVQDLADITQFEPGGGRDLTDVVLQATIVGIDGFCETEFDDGTATEVTAEMRVLFRASRGPADTDRQSAFRYFVAIADRAGNPLQKHVFDTTVEFPGNRNRVAPFEELTLTIRLQPGENGGDYSILAGFQLTPEQLEYNRDRRIR